MKQHFYKELQNLAPKAETARFLLAVSGGRDSVVLAHLFATCNLHFDIAHCNFHLRGEASNKEMYFVQHLPFLNGQTVFVKEFDTINIQKNSGKSIEMIARELRYQWFEEVGKDYDYIVTAHHANDNAETILLNLLRGCGLRGMCGIPPKNGKIIRPLLRFQSIVIDEYVHEQGIRFCVDASNLSDAFLRNKVRHHIIPKMEEICPNLIDSFSKNSDIFLQQTHFFDTHIQHYKKQLLKEEEERITIAIDALTKMENQSFILYEMLNPLGFNANQVAEILKSIHSTSGKRFLSETHILIKDRNQFIIEKNLAEKEDTMLINSIEELEQYGFKVEKKHNNSTFQPIKDRNIIYIDAKKLIFPLTLRKWEKGDFFYPFGMKTKKKLSDLFTDLKIDLFEKQKVHLLCSQEKIVWVVGYRADERFRVNAETRDYYTITKVITSL